MVAYILVVLLISRIYCICILCICVYIYIHTVYYTLSRCTSHLSLPVQNLSSAKVPALTGILESVTKLHLTCLHWKSEIEKI